VKADPCEQKEGQTQTTKLTVAFLSCFAKASNKLHRRSLCDVHSICHLMTQKYNRHLHL